MTGAATKDAARVTASRILGVISRGFRGHRDNLEIHNF
jgi:hypothetical protein